MENSALKDRIALARKQASLSKAEVARRLGIPYSTYDSYERGHREPRLNVLQRIADVLGADGYFLATGDVGDSLTSSVTKMLNAITTLAEENVHRFTPVERTISKATTMTPGQYNALMIEYKEWLDAHDITHDEIHHFIEIMRDIISSPSVASSTTDDESSPEG